MVVSWNSTLVLVQWLVSIQVKRPNQRRTFRDILLKESNLESVNIRITGLKIEKKKNRTKEVQVGVWTIA